MLSTPIYSQISGIVFWFGVFSDLGERVEQRRDQNTRAKAAVAPTKSGAPATAPAAPSSAPGNNTVQRSVNTMVEEIKAQAEATRQEYQKNRNARKKFGPVQGFYAWRNGMVGFLSHLPRPAMYVIWFFEVGGLIFYVFQLPATFVLEKLDYEMRWYMVTDISLRIRHGIWKVNESTMSFANIQQVEVSQGPLQRLLGLADVKVQSAGGGGGDGSGSLCQ